jgi:PleD family two-component response regulator
MSSTAPRVLLADTPQALPLVARLLGDEFVVNRASTWQEALRCLETGQPQIAVIGYHFDDLRPYRLVQAIRAADERGRVPVILVRALPVLPDHTDEKEIEESYRQLGVDTYLVLDKAARGDDFAEVSKRLRAAIRRLCS